MPLLGALDEAVGGKTELGDGGVVPGGGELVDTYELTRHFTSGGTLASTLENFEQRDAQASMAEAVADAFNDGHFLSVDSSRSLMK